MIKRLLIVIGAALGIVFIPYFIGLLIPMRGEPYVPFRYLMGILCIAGLFIVGCILWVLLPAITNLINWIKYGD